MELDLREQGQAEDLRLLRRYAEAGDEDSFRLVARRYLDFVYVVCLRDLGDRQAAEDATQETFIALARRAGRLRVGTVLPSWLFVVALRRCQEVRRKEARHHRLMQPPKSPADSTDAAMDLQLALARLSAADREVVILRELMEYSHAEVARAIGISENAARMRADRAMKQLRERVGTAAMLLLPLERAPFGVQDLRLPRRSRRRVRSWVLASGAAILVLAMWGGFESLHRTGAHAGVFRAAATSAPAAAVAVPTRAELLPFYAKVTITEGVLRGKLGAPGMSAGGGSQWDVLRWRLSYEVGPSGR